MTTDHPPTPTPTPMSEDELQAIENRHQVREAWSKDLYDLQRHRDESALLAEVRRLNAEISTSEVVLLRKDRDNAVDYATKLESELRAVRAAVTEESQRADRAEVLAKDAEEAKEHATNLFAIVAPQCKPLDTLNGLISQLDNFMSCVMEDRDRAEAAARELRAVLKSGAIVVNELGKMTPEQRSEELREFRQYQERRVDVLEKTAWLIGEAS